VAGDETLFRGVRKLLPGHTLSLTLDGSPLGHRSAEVRRYWRPPVGVVSDERSFADCGRDLRNDLTEAVRSHLMSDVPLGMFLSGGIDSSAIAALMSRMVS